tara:strand:- start:16914 stop:17048 length:135 start_codon:yes stop_codon:yes gene_type:complete
MSLNVNHSSKIVMVLLAVLALTMIMIVKTEKSVQENRSVFRKQF